MKATDEIIYVLCGNIQEFRAYCFKQTHSWPIKSGQKIDGKRYMFVSSEEVLLGIEKPKLVLFGQYQFRNDHRKIIQMAQARDAKIIMEGEEDGN